MKAKNDILPTAAIALDSLWEDDIFNDININRSSDRSGGQAECGGRFPCPGEAPSIRGVPPLCAIKASPGAPRCNNPERLERLRMQIANGTYLTDDIIEETANKFLSQEILSYEHDDI